MKIKDNTVDQRSPLAGQGLLFDEELPEFDDAAGFRGPAAQRAAGISYRQLDYWARTGLVQPSLRSANGSGTQRLYSFRDIVVLKIVKRLLDSGVSLQQVRVAVEHLQGRGTQDLAQVTLISDGATVYECTSAEELFDIVRGGQGVFGIALGPLYRDVRGDLAALPTEHLSDQETYAAGTDELAARRRQRQIG